MGRTHVQIAIPACEDMKPRIWFLSAKSKNNAARGAGLATPVPEWKAWSGSQGAHVGRAPFRKRYMV